MSVRTLRTILIVQILALAVVALLHSGVLTGAPLARAALYEVGVAIVLAIGLALTFAGPTIARVGAFVTQLLALFGLGTGVYMALNGMAPNSILDLAYLALALVLLLAGLYGAMRLEVNESTDDGAGTVRA